MIVQPGSPSRLAHLAFCGNDDDVRRANNIAFQRSGARASGILFQELREDLSPCLWLSRAVAFRDVTRRKETMCLAVLRCAGAMKISTASLSRDREKINISFSKWESKGEKERNRRNERINTMNRKALRE